MFVCKVTIDMDGGVGVYRVNNKSIMMANKKIKDLFVCAKDREK